MLIAVASPAFAQVDQPGTTAPRDQTTARDDGVLRTLVTDNKIAAGDGGSLTRGIANVMVDRHGECRWLDNNNTELDYFVPTGTPTDWASFISNKPASIRIDGCCPDTSVVLTASDGQTHSINTGVGRENSTGPYGQKQLSYTFTVSDGSGGFFAETVSENFTCRNGLWEGDGETRTGAPTHWDVGAWGVCSADCEGTQSRSVVCLDGDGNPVADGSCSGLKPATTQACGEETCTPVTDPNGVCGNAVNGGFDRSTPPPAATALKLCANGSPTVPFRKDAITWEWTCKGTDSTATCNALRIGAAEVVKSDCRPEANNTPAQNSWHGAGNYYTYVCGVDRRMPKNSYLTAAHWSIPQMVNNYTGKYSCLQAGWPKMIGATTGGDDWHRAYYTGWTPRPGTTGDNLSDYYQSSRGDQCQGCVVLEDLYCTDEEDYPAGCAEKDVEYITIPPLGACEPPTRHQGRLPTGTYGQSGTMGNTRFTCGLYGWKETGIYEPPSKQMSGDTVECW